MAEVTSMNESDWGPEQTQIPPVGSIFILKLYGNGMLPTVVSQQGRYKLTGLNGSGMTLELWNFGRCAWQPGHHWTHSEGVTFRVLGGATVQVSVAKAVSNGCHCSKCQNHFPYAEPNQSDGSMICWNCRNYPHYQGRL